MQNYKISKDKENKTTFKDNKDIIPTYIKFKKLSIKERESHSKEKKEEDDEKQNNITFVYPLAARIISEKEYKKLNKFDHNQNPQTFGRKRYSNEVCHNQPLPSIQMKINNSSKLYSSWSLEKLETEIKRMKKEIESKENELKQKDKTKELEKFTSLTKKWKKILQEAIYKLIECFPQNEQYRDNTVETVIKTFNIDKDLIGFDEENDCFFDE